MTQGARWWPDEAFEREHIAPEQEARFEADAWEEPIRQHIFGQPSVLVKDVAVGALGLETGRIGRKEQNRITSILEGLEWRRMKKDSRGNVAWEPSTNTTDDGRLRTTF